MNFGTLLRTTRKQTGWTLQRAAEVLGCSVAFLSDVELAHRKALRADQIAQLCAAFGVDSGPLMRAAADEGRGVTIRSQSSLVMEAAMGLARGDVGQSELQEILRILQKGERK